MSVTVKISANTAHNGQWPVPGAVGKTSGIEAVRTERFIVVNQVVLPRACGNSFIGNRNWYPVPNL